MALPRPEGVSPAYTSVATPDIPESNYFRWTFRSNISGDYQTSFKITILDENRNQLKTYSEDSQETEVSLADVGYAFQRGKSYYWNVVAYNRNDEASTPSVTARFLYGTSAIHPSIVWNHIPKPGDEVVSNTYFQEIKNNIIYLLRDYKGISPALSSNIQELFTGEVIPNRKDFVTLEKVVNVISSGHEGTTSLDADAPVEDSLGVSDLEKIRRHIDMLASVKPKPVEKLSISVASPTMYQIARFDARSDGKLDPTLDSSWDVTAIPSYRGTFTFDRLSESKDVRYYICRFEYGPSNNPFLSELYFTAEQLTNGYSFTFDTDWDGLFTASTIGLARHSFQVQAVDHRGNASSTRSVTKTYGSNFRAPLGVRRYELALQRAKLGDTAPDRNGEWRVVYSGPNEQYTYKMTGGEGRIYFRVRAVDLSGLTTDWSYDNGITYDPLTPPAAPKNFRSTSNTTTSLRFDWDKSARAESYEFRRTKTGGNVYAGTNTYDSVSGLSPATSYTYYVRAKNRVGVSDWVSAVGKTKSARKTTSKKATRGKSWRDNWGWRSDNTFVYQGEWCEIEGSPHQSGPAGTCWGKHKGMWLFDDDYWRTTLKNKKIVKVEIWVQRKSWYHGYYKDQVPTFWLHNYDSFPKGEPKFTNKYKPGNEFDLGESGWVKLPNSYGEAIRDNKAKGIGVYVDKWGKLPYIQFYDNAKLRITYE